LAGAVFEALALKASLSALQILRVSRGVEARTARSDLGKGSTFVLSLPRA